VPPRAVSDVVATILLVAIGVVLAAILYVLVVGTTTSSGSAPIGSAFAAGHPVLQQQSGTAGATTCSSATTTLAGSVATGDWTYTLDIVASSVEFGHVLFQVRGSAGTLAPSNVAFFVSTISGLVAACAGSTAVPASGSMGGAVQFTYPSDAGLGSTSPLNSLYQIVVEMGPTSPAALGYSFDAVGQGAYSGVTASVALP
jgi:hypothetical protein